MWLIVTKYATHNLMKYYLLPSVDDVCAQFSNDVWLSWEIWDSLNVRGINVGSYFLLHSTVEFLGIFLTVSFGSAVYFSAFFFDSAVIMRVTGDGIEILR